MLEIIVLFILENCSFQIALLIVIVITGIFSFIQEHRGAAIAKAYEKLCPHVA